MMNRAENQHNNSKRKGYDILPKFLCVAAAFILWMYVTQVETSNYEEDFKNGWQYRMELNEFLNSGTPKIIKNWEGKMFLSSITNVEEDQSGHIYNPIHTVSFTEIGDCEDGGDLYDNGIIDANSDR